MPEEDPSSRLRADERKSEKRHKSRRASKIASPASSRKHKTFVRGDFGDTTCAAVDNKATADGRSIYFQHGNSCLEARSSRRFLPETTSEKGRVEDGCCKSSRPVSYGLDRARKRGLTLLPALWWRFFKALSVFIKGAQHPRPH